KFIEDLVPAFELTAILCALHRFISNQGELRLAVPQILKGDYVVRITYGLMFDSIVRGLDLVSLRVSKVHRVNDLLVRNDLVVFPTIPELVAIRRFHAAKKLATDAKIDLAER